MKVSVQCRSCSFSQGVKRVASVVLPPVGHIIVELCKAKSLISFVLIRSTTLSPLGQTNTHSHVTMHTHTFSYGRDRGHPTALEMWPFFSISLSINPLLPSVHLFPLFFSQLKHSLFTISKVLSRSVLPSIHCARGEQTH